MEGQALTRTVRSDAPVREAGLFGMFGSHVSVTDGRYVYMRASATPENRPLSEHTLMPTHMRARFSPEELADAELIPPEFSFTKGAPLLKMPAWAMGSPWNYGTLLFDLETDPEQETPLDDPALELRMIGLLEAELGQEARKEFLPMQPGDVPATAADTTAIERDIGFRQTTPIEVGIPRFVAWYRDFYGV